MVSSHHRGTALYLLRGDNSPEGIMKSLLKILIPIGLLAAMTGCVVAPYGYHRGYWGGYYGPRVGVVVPAPAVIVRP